MHRFKLDAAVDGLQQSRALHDGRTDGDRLHAGGQGGDGQKRTEYHRLAKMFMAASLGIQERRKAKLGDKTIVDVLHPAAEAFSVAIAAGDPLEAARKGRDAANPLRSMMGSANWVGERTEGPPDPGTVLLVGALEAVLGADFSEPGSTL